MKLAISSSAALIAGALLGSSAPVSGAEPKGSVEYEVFADAGGVELTTLPSARANFDLDKMTYVFADTQSKLVSCTSDAAFFCLKTSGFHFAVPTPRPLKQQGWKIDEVEYRVERQLPRIELLGTTFEDVSIISSRQAMCGSAACDVRHQYVFSAVRGLVATLTATSIDGTPQIQVDLLRGKCGLAALASCGK